MKAILEKMAYYADQHYESSKKWKEEHEGGKVVGILPMHFPAEVFHAAGAMPILLQEGPDAVTLGHSYMFPYYCGFTRSLADQAAKGDLNFIDEFIVGSGASSVQGLCVQDVIMAALPNKVIDTNELIAFMEDPWMKESVMTTFKKMRDKVERVTGKKVTDDALKRSIRLYNRGRELMRELYELRRAGNAALNSMQMQDIVKSSMVMDIEEHNAMLEELVPLVRANPVSRTAEKIPVFVSGHMCQAAKPDVLRLIGEAGGEVVDDDLYHGWRYIVQTVCEDVDDPIEALAQAYLDKNKACPCPTRVDPTTNWELMLLDAVYACGARGLIILQAKYCEPHMFYYAEIKEAFEEAGIPHLLLETEHEVVSMEGIRTRIESFVESIKVVV